MRSIGFCHVMLSFEIARSNRSVESVGANESRSDVIPMDTLRKCGRRRPV